MAADWRAFPYTSALPAFQAADDAWDAELRRLFKDAACMARYQERGRGPEGSELRRLYDAKHAARARWHASSAP